MAENAALEPEGSARRSAMAETDLCIRAFDKAPQLRQEGLWHYLAAWIEAEDAAPEVLQCLGFFSGRHEQRRQSTPLTNRRTYG
jgi:hypothetical protein